MFEGRNFWKSNQSRPKEYHNQFNGPQLIVICPNVEQRSEQIEELGLLWIRGGLHHSRKGHDSWFLQKRFSV